MKSMRRRPLRFQAGLTYVESLLAVLLLAVSLVPVMQAIDHNFTGRNKAGDSIQPVRCAQDAMERVVAQQYSDLLAAAVSTHSAGIFSTPTAYSLSPTASCPNQRNVYILRYDPALVDPFASGSNDMLYVRVEQADGFTIATLAMRQ